MAKTWSGYYGLFQLRIHGGNLVDLLRTSKEAENGIRIGIPSEQSLLFAASDRYWRSTADASTDVGTRKDDPSDHDVATASDQFGSTVAAHGESAKSSPSDRGTGGTECCETGPTGRNSSATETGDRIDASGTHTGGSKCFWMRIVVWKVVSFRF